MDDHQTLRASRMASAGLAVIIALSVWLGSLAFGFEILPALGAAVFAWVGAWLCFTALGGRGRG